MKNNAVDISIVLDKSGSMDSVRNDTIHGFNGFLKDQAKLPGEANLSLTVFDTEVKPLYAGKPIAAAPQLDETTYQPSGGTALLDAIGRAITATGNRLSAIPEPQRPEKVLFVIFTDGEENSSREFNYPQIAGMIAHQRDIYKWAILFIGADQDAIAKASRIGIQATNALSTANNTIGTQSYYTAISKKATFMRSSPIGSCNVSFDDEDREEQKKAGSKF